MQERKTLPNVKGKGEMVAYWVNSVPDSFLPHGLCPSVHAADTARARLNGALEGSCCNQAKEEVKAIPSEQEAVALQSVVSFEHHDAPAHQHDTPTDVPLEAVSTIEPVHAAATL